MTQILGLRLGCNYNGNTQIEETAIWWANSLFAWVAETTNYSTLSMDSLDDSWHILGILPYSRTFAPLSWSWDLTNVGPTKSWKTFSVWGPSRDAMNWLQTCLLGTEKICESWWGRFSCWLRESHCFRTIFCYLLKSHGVCLICYSMGGSTTSWI